MTRVNIREILLLYRPGTLDAEDPQITAAIEFTKHDPELGCWFGQHKIFQAKMRAKFLQIEPPEGFKLALLAHQKILNSSPSVWRRPMWLAAAAAVVLFAASLATVSLRPNVPDRFENYRDMMVSKAVRGYAMEWEGKDMHQLRDLIVARGAPANYELTRGLQQSQLAGGTTFRWRQ